MKTLALVLALVLASDTLVTAAGAWTPARGAGAPPASPMRSDTPVTQVLSGAAERQRVLELAGELEVVDAAAAKIWERIIALLAASATLAPDDRQTERRLRTDTLPVLAARHAEYRRREIEAEKQLVEHGRRGGEPAQGALELAGRLSSVRRWSDLTSDIQQNVRSRLDGLHTAYLVASRTSAGRLPSDLLEELRGTETRRRDLEARHGQAVATWQARLEAQQLDTEAQTLTAAHRLVGAATSVQALAEGLERRHQQGRTDGDELARAIAGRARAAVADIGRWAAAQAGTAWLDRESFLTAPALRHAGDAALGALASGRGRITRELLASLERRIRSLDELRPLVTERERIFARAQADLPKTAEGTHDRVALATLVRTADTTWREIHDLRRLIGAIGTASASRERTVAAELLALHAETIVPLEQLVLDAETTLVADFILAPDNPRRRARPRWQGDLNALDSLHARWRRWHQAWDRHRDVEQPLFAALDRTQEHLAQLHARRLRDVAQALGSARDGDPITGFLTAAGARASTELAAFRQAQAEQKRTGEALASDPILRAMLQRISGHTWTRAAAGSRGLPLTERQVELLAFVSREAATARNASVSMARRLTSVVAISDALGIPWTLERDGDRLDALVVVEDREFVLEGLDEPRASTLREVVRSGARSGPAPWSFARGLLRPAAAEAQSPGDGRYVLHSWNGIKKECADAKNWLVYTAIVGIGVCAGIPGGPPGMLAGGKIGLVVAGGAAAVDAGGGAIKGAARAHTADPAAHQRVDIAVDVTKGVVALAQGAAGLRALTRAGAGAGGRVAQSIGQRTQNIADLQGKLAKAQQALQQARSGSEAARAAQAIQSLAPRLKKAQEGLTAVTKGAAQTLGTVPRLVDAADDVKGGLDAASGTPSPQPPRVGTAQPPTTTATPTPSPSGSPTATPTPPAPPLGPTPPAPTPTPSTPGPRPPAPPATPPAVEREKTLVVVAPSKATPGASAGFRAVLVVDVPVPGGAVREERRDVTALAAWHVGGAAANGGIAHVDCSLAGRTITAQATYRRLSASANAVVEPLPLLGLRAAASATSASPGDNVGLTATATYGSGACRRDVDVSDTVGWTASAGGAIGGRRLAIAKNKQDGAVTASATLAGLSSNTISVGILAPTLKRFEIAAPASVAPCGTAEFRAFAYYSNALDTPRDVTDHTSWSFAGPHTTVARNRARGEWPNATLVGSASFQGVTAQRAVKVGAASRAALFDASFTTLNVGESKRNVLMEFYCNGARPDYRVVQGARWTSAQPGRLPCSPDGTCTGRAPGFALVLWSYRGTTGAGRRVEVGGGHVAQLLRVACTPTRVPVGATVRCQAFGVHAERPGIVADVSEQVTWTPGVEFRADRPGNINVTARYASLAQSATVAVTSPRGPAQGAAPAASPPTERKLSCYDQCMKTCKANGGPPGTGQLFDVSAKLCPPYCGGKGCEGKQ